MRRSQLVAAAMCGLTVSAMAQGPDSRRLTLYFDVDSTDFMIGSTYTWTVSAEFTGWDNPTAYFGGFEGSFVASDPSLGVSSNFVNLMNNQAIPAAGNGASVEMINIFNAALLGTDDQTNPLPIFQFDMVFTAAGVLSYNAIGTASMFPNDGPFTVPRDTEFEVVSDSLGIPAPAVGVAVTMGGLVATRRRRN